MAYSYNNQNQLFGKAIRSWCYFDFAGIFSHDLIIFLLDLFSTGLSLAVLNLSIVIPQMVVSVLSGPWDALFGGGNIPAFVVGAVAAAASAVIALFMLPSPPPDLPASKTGPVIAFH